MTFIGKIQKKKKKKNKNAERKDFFLFLYVCGVFLPFSPLPIFPISFAIFYFFFFFFVAKSHNDREEKN